jgi:hypothetical protein
MICGIRTIDFCAKHGIHGIRTIDFYAKDGIHGIRTIDFYINAGIHGIKTFDFCIKAGIHAIRTFDLCIEAGIRGIRTFFDLCIKATIDGIAAADFHIEGTIHGIVTTDFSVDAAIAAVAVDFAAKTLDNIIHGTRIERPSTGIGIAILALFRRRGGRRLDRDQRVKRQGLPAPRLGARRAELLQNQGRALGDSENLRSRPGADLAMVVSKAFALMLQAFGRRVGFLGGVEADEKECRLERSVARVMGQAQHLLPGPSSPAFSLRLSLSDPPSGLRCLMWSL